MLLFFASIAERDVFESLYNTYRTLMYRKAMGILRDEMLAEDAVSEAFLRIYKNMDKIDGVTTPRTASFVVTIVKNTALTILSRENSKRGELSLDDEDAPDAVDPESLEDFALSKITTQEIFALMNRLPEEQRAVFVMRFAHDMTMKGIAQTLGITENNAAVRLNRARNALAKILTEEGYVSK